MEINIELQQSILKFSDKNIPQNILHGRPHRDRVLKYAKLINKKKVKASWDIIYISVLCHDIGHRFGRENHHIKSADLTQIFMNKLGIDIRIIENVKHCILTHSRQFSACKPETEEAKVLYDADGMDLFGAIGIQRAILSCGIADTGLDCLIKKLKWRLQVASDFYSKTAMKYVKNNMKIIKAFINSLEQ